jgi:MerR family transcriptional regulator, light-induced transcriptional regulator
MSVLAHSIKVAARKTGLTPHVIRVWERRYGAVKPGRTESNRRRYSEEDLERLSLLHQATLAGYSIGAIANLPMKELVELSKESIREMPSEKPGADSAEGFLTSGLKAVRALDSRALDTVLSEAAVALGQHGMLERVVAVLAKSIGNGWRDGTLLAAHEHFASASIRDFLAKNSRPFSLNESAPLLVVATPSGQLHELGAVIVAAAANDLGWRVMYLGASLPAVEIAAAALQNQARAVALSIVYPEDDPNLPQELENLRKYLPPATRVIAGGRAAETYGNALKRIGAIQTKELRELYGHLEELRRTRSL